MGSFIRHILWLLWKNFKTDIRRPLGCFCEFILPLFVFAIFGYIRSQISRSNYDINWGDSFTKIDAYDFSNTQKINDSIINNPGNTLYFLNSPNLYREVADIICKNNCEDSVCNIYYTAQTIAFIPDPSTNPILQTIFNSFKESWEVTQKYYFQANFSVDPCYSQFCSSIEECSDRGYYPLSLCPVNECGYQNLTFYSNETGSASIIKIFDSESDLEDYISNSKYATNWEITDTSGKRPVAFAIIFNNPSDWSSIRYTLRGNASIYPSTDTDSNIDKFTKNFYTLYSQSASGYIEEGFTTLQLFINSIIISNNGLNINDYSQQYVLGYFPMPTAAYSTDSFYSLLTGLFPFLLIIAFIYPYFAVVGVIVEDKTSKIKEGLRMMGTTSSQYWLSWYLYIGFKFLLIAALCTIISRAVRMFEYSNGFIIFLWFYLFMLTLLASAVLFSTFFDNPRTGSTVSIVFLLALYFLSAAGTSLEETGKGWLCLSGPACFAMGANNFGAYETGFIGLQWDNLDEEYSKFEFQTVLIMMFVDIIIYSILAMYLDLVFPSQYGFKLPWYFPLDPHYWCLNKNKKTRLGDDSIELDLLSTEKKEVEHFEKVNRSNDDVVIEVLKLRKEFSSGFRQPPFVAVDDISVKMYTSEVFCLLGHNGAGKTTTINMLSGMLSVTSGHAIINGLDVVTEMNEIRQFLGVCPQHDVLWPKLTVEEHLRFFANLKGVNKNNLNTEVDRMIEQTGLSQYRNYYPPQLSGGNRRKLSLGIALIGGSRVVFLDEPTSGMDPHSRRDAWELIKQNKKGRCIILTTHFMDEADILGDRIGIMAKGKIKCCGTSLFLKKLYGVGYSFTISLMRDHSVKYASSSILHEIQSFIPQAEILSSHGTELVLRLPFESSKQFPNMFRRLDQVLQDLAIENYGISVTTLEEVFFRVGNEEFDVNKRLEEERVKKLLSQKRIEELDAISELDKPSEAKQNNPDIKIVDPTVQQDLTKQDPVKTDGSDLDQNSIPKKTVSSVNIERRWSELLDEARTRSQKVDMTRQIYAMLYKKFNYAKRDKRAWLCQILLPFLFMCLSFGLIDLQPPSNYNSLILDSSQFDNAIGYNNESLNSTYNNMVYLWTPQFSSIHGSLKGYKGDGGLQYNETSYTLENNPQYFRTFKYSLFSVSDKSPHYNAYYFPTEDVNNSTGRINTNNSNNYAAMGFNVSAYHGFPVGMQILSNLILQRYNSNSKITTYVKPLPTTQGESAFWARIEGFANSGYLSLALAFFPLSVIYNVVYERERSTKHQQLVSGVNFVAYWTGSFIWDAIMILPSCFLAWVLVEIFQTEAFLGESLGPFVLQLLLYGTAIVGFTYVISFLFVSAQRAFFVTLILYFFLGYGFGIATFIMSLFPSVRQASKIIAHIVRISPSFLSTSTMLYLSNRSYGIPGIIPAGLSAWDWRISGYNLTLLAIETIGYFLLTLLIEYLTTIPNITNWFTPTINMPKEQEKLDPDVQHEKDRLQHYVVKDEHGNVTLNSTCKDPIFIGGLRKVYTEKKDTIKPAVKDLWYSVPRGEVFGFLGVNGAGKTTTLSMLCGKFPQTEGVAFINRVPISDQLVCRKMIGYCPQFDALFDLLTAREHLYIYAIIKGLDTKKFLKESDDLLDKLTLREYENKISGTYSGGNKRKLSVAIAMIGSPPIVFLDEPSTGMDPVSRRHMWDFISSTMLGRSVILTTHSMEECEALCHRIGIMVTGQLQCLGTAQHLKSRYGKGYQLDIHLNPNQENKVTNEVICDELNKEFETKVELLEMHDTNIRINIPVENMSLADVFEHMETIKDKLNIQEYALNQTTLEQIFIQMAGHQ